MLGDAFVAFLNTESMQVNMPVHMVCQYEIGWPILKQAAWPILKQAGPLRNRLPAMACFKMGQIKIYLLIGLTSFKMGQPVLKWAAGFKMAKF